MRVRPAPILVLIQVGLPRVRPPGVPAPVQAAVPGSERLALPGPGREAQSCWQAARPGALAGQPPHGGWQLGSGRYVKRARSAEQPAVAVQLGS